MALTLFLYHGIKELRRDNKIPTLILTQEMNHVVPYSQDTTKLIPLDKRRFWTYRGFLTLYFQQRIGS